MISFLPGEHVPIFSSDDTDIDDFLNLTETNESEFLRCRKKLTTYLPASFLRTLAHGEANVGVGPRDRAPFSSPSSSLRHPTTSHRPPSRRCVGAAHDRALQHQPCRTAVTASFARQRRRRADRAERAGPAGMADHGAAGIRELASLAINALPLP